MSEGNIETAENNEGSEGNNDTAVGPTSGEGEGQAGNENEGQVKSESEIQENNEIKNSEDDPFADEENKEQQPIDKPEQVIQQQFPPGVFPPGPPPPGRFFPFPYPPAGPQGKFFPFPLPGPNFPPQFPPGQFPFNPNQNPNTPNGPPMPFPPGQFPFQTPFFSPFMKPGLYPSPFSNNSNFSARSSLGSGRTPKQVRNSLSSSSPSGSVRSALLERLCRNRECLELIPFGSNNNKRFCKKSCLYRHNNLKKEHMKSSADRTLLALRNRLETFVEQAEAEHKPEQEIKNDFEKLRAELKDLADKHMNN